MDISKRNNPMIANIDYINPYVKNSQLPSLRYYNEIKSGAKTVGTPALFQQDLMFLNEKLEAVQKRLTFYDFYNIAAIVEDPSLLQTTINNLLPNTALIINTNNAGNYNRGDIVFKTSTGDIQTIRAQSGGLYYPAKLTKSGNNYTLEYKYSASAPTIGQPAEEVSLDQTANLSTSITFKGLTDASKSEGIAYGVIKQRGEENWNSIEAVATPVDNKLIWPVIKFFTDWNEEVYFTYTLTPATKAGEKFIINNNNIPSIVSQILYK